MNASSSTSANSWLSHVVTRRLLIVWLPIIIVGVMIFCLSGGMPPTSWLLLLQMLSRWSRLQTSLGNAFFISFAIILMQCLFILIAWIILAFTIWREISVFSTLRAQRISTLQEKLAAAENTPIILQSSPVVSGQQGVQLMPEKQEKNTGIKIVSAESDEQDDIFDMNNAVFELSSETSENPVDDPSAQPQQIKEEEEAVFLYGNPFEGELPEVFHYDIDLKRGVQSIQEELHSQQKGGTEKSIDLKDNQDKDTEQDK